jgi:TonB family protein
METTRPWHTNKALRAVLMSFVMSISILSTEFTMLQAEEKIYKGTDEGVTPPKPLKRVRAEYDETAKAQKVKGIVKLDAVVSRDGKLRNITVSESLDPRLDAKAIAAAKQWQWEPARFKGKVVACKVRLEIGFEP